MQTALMKAVNSYYAKRKIPLLKALIDAPQNFHLTNNKGQTALDIAEARFKKATASEDKKFYSLIIAMLKRKMAN